MGVHEFDQVRWLTGQEFGALRVAAARPDAAEPASERAEGRGAVFPTNSRRGATKERQGARREGSAS